MSGILFSFYLIIEFVNFQKKDNDNNAHKNMFKESVNTEYYVLVFLKV